MSLDDNHDGDDVVVDDEYYATIDENYDGNYVAAGFQGMMMQLDQPGFLEFEDLEFEGDQEFTKSLNSHEEFFFLDVDNLEHDADKLRRRELSMADGLIRRIVEGNCPPRIRIRRVLPEDRKQILDSEKQGNDAFGRKEYQVAIGLYEQAMELFPMDFFIGPVTDINDIVTLLSNTAECHLRLKEYTDAGMMATQALVFDSRHVKTKIRRAKAAILEESSSAAALIQARNDLEHVLEETTNAMATSTAQDLLGEVKSKLETKQDEFHENRPDGDWDFYVRLIKSKCW